MWIDQLREVLPHFILLFGGLAIIYFALRSMKPLMDDDTIEDRIVGRRLDKWEIDLMNYVVRWLLVGATIFAVGLVSTLNWLFGFHCDYVQVITSAIVLVIFIIVLFYIH